MGQPERIDQGPAAAGDHDVVIVLDSWPIDSDAFDHVFNSYYLGKGKRDVSLFTDIAAKLALPPSALLFVDDNPDNVARARNAGLQAIHYVDRQRFLAEMEKLLD